MPEAGSALVRSNGRRARTVRPCRRPSPFASRRCEPARFELTTRDQRLQGTRQRDIKIGGQYLRRNTRRRRVRPHHQQDPRRDTVDPLGQQRSQTSLHPGTGDRRPDRPGHHEPDPRRGRDDRNRHRHGRRDRGRCDVRIDPGRMHDQRSTSGPAPTFDRRVEVTTTTHPVRGRQHVRPPGAAGSGGEFGAALTPARRKDGATRSGTHTQPETVGLGPAPVIRLEGPLAHQKAPRSCCQRGHANRTSYPRVHDPVRGDAAQPPALTGRRQRPLSSLHTVRPRRPGGQTGSLCRHCAAATEQPSFS
jgi:hypothetical protein